MQSFYPKFTKAIELPHLKEIDGYQNMHKFSEGDAVGFYHDGLYRYIYCPCIWKVGGFYSFFSSPVSPDKLTFGEIHQSDGLCGGIEPSETKWEGTDLEFAFIETGVEYRWFGLKKSSSVTMQAGVTFSRTTGKYINGKLKPR